MSTLRADLARITTEEIKPLREGHAELRDLLIGFKGAMRMTQLVVFAAAALSAVNHLPDALHQLAHLLSEH